mmetsp:Transcript_8141/g.17585  ORF Transcript_8141/g.17585 Transcript_8141/m.17585 type:complete len:407 (-) Transcript_8141:189-1409(-)
MATDTTSGKSAWKDLKRRALTVTLGVPSIILLLRHPITSWLFFQGAHLLCLLEWRALIPPTAAEGDSDDTSTTAARSKNEIGDGNDNKGDRTEKQTSTNGNTILRAILTKLNTKEEAANSVSPLSKSMFHLFCCFSLVITVLPTALLPLALMFHGIASRFLPHLILLTNTQSSSQTTNNNMNAAFFTAMQHYQFGLLYLSVGFHYILQISKVGGPLHIGNLLFVIWMSDTGALVVGRAMKKRVRDTNNATIKEVKNGSTDWNQTGFFISFIKSISPGKTLPGMLGAILTGPISALIYPISLSAPIICESEAQCIIDEDVTSILSFLSTPTTLHLQNLFHNPYFQKALLGLILSLAGILGDLAESSVKRLSKKKDSGGLLPGHGGIVDRFDSLFVGAVVYYYFGFGF